MKKIRRNALRVAAFLVCLMLVCVLYGGWSLVRNGNRWFSSGANTLIKEQKKQVTPGNIYDRNGVVLAQTDSEGNRIYSEDAGIRRAMVHVLGDIDNNVSNGVESFMARYLYGFDMSFTEKAGYLLSGKRYTGDNVFLTVDSTLSANAAAWFPQGKNGAVVVMNYRTGEVLAEMSFSQFDPESVDSSVRNDPDKPFWNRAVQMQKAPGSTFKVITAACALENMAGLDYRQFDCDGLLQVGDHRITDAGTDLASNKITAHGKLTLQQAFVKSCNNTFAQVALELGDTRLRKTAENFGFNDNFLFRDIVVENSSYPTDNRTELELAWTGAGQSALLTSPMHMCMVAAAIANGGVMQEPWLLARAVSQKGSVRYEGTEHVYRRAVSADVAETLKGCMRLVVTEGTGTAAGVTGHRICGKTGSAERDGQENTDAWFIGFIDEEKYPYALCVMVEDAGGGGSVAAPVAGKIFRYLLRQNQ